MAPPTIGAIGLGSTVAGGIFSSFSSTFQGASQQKMYEYQAGISQINAMIAERNALHATEKGEKEAVRYGIKAGQQMGAIKTAQASAGLDVNSGSNKRVQDSQEKVARLDNQTIRDNAAKVAYDYITQAQQFRNQSELYEMAGENAMTAGLLNSLGSIISTTGSVSAKWLQGNQMGLFGAR